MRVPVVAFAGQEVRNTNTFLLRLLLRTQGKTLKTSRSYSSVVCELSCSWAGFSSSPQPFARRRRATRSSLQTQHTPPVHCSSDFPRHLGSVSSHPIHSQFLPSQFEVLSRTRRCIRMNSGSASPSSSLGHEYVRYIGTSRHDAVVIFLHGLGDTGEGWSMSGLEHALPYAKFIFPTASVRPITLNMGMPMPGWFDINSLAFETIQDDVKGMTESVYAIRTIIDREIQNGVSTDRIVIAGFSQGGAIALLVAMTHPVSFAGVIGLSTWLPLHKQLLKTIPCDGANSESQEDTLIRMRNWPHILLCHGDCDNVVAPQYNDMTLKALQELGIKDFNDTSQPGKGSVKNVVYQGMSHSSCQKELQDVAKWLRERLPPLEK